MIPQRRNLVNRLLLPTTSLFSQAFIFPVNSGITLLGSVRLEVRRISGNLRKDQVYWEEGDDGDDGSYVFDPDGVTIIDDEALGYPPYVTFEFKFRQFTQPKADSEKNEDIGKRVTRKSTKSGNTLALPVPVMGKAEGSSFFMYGFT